MHPLLPLSSNAMTETPRVESTGIKFPFATQQSATFAKSRIFRESSHRIESSVSNSRLVQTSKQIMHTTRLSKSDPFSTWTRSSNRMIRSLKNRITESLNSTSTSNSASEKTASSALHVICVSNRRNARKRIGDLFRGKSKEARHRFAGGGEVCSFDYSFSSPSFAPIFRRSRGMMATSDVAICRNSS